MGAASDIREHTARRLLDVGQTSRSASIGTEFGGFDFGSQAKEQEVREEWKG